MIKIFFIFLSISAFGAGSQFNNYDWESQNWTKTRVPAVSSSVASNEYISVTKFLQKLKQSGLRTKIKNCGVYLGADLNAVKVPLIASGNSSNNINGFVSGDYTSTGLTGNTTTKFLQSTRDLASDTTINNLHLSVYIQTGSNESSYCIGSADGGLNCNCYIAVSYLGTSYGHLGDGVNGYASVADANGTGFYVVSRTSALAGGVSLYKNGVSIATTANAPGATSLPTEVVGIHAYNNSGSLLGRNSRTFSFYDWGTGLTANDTLNYYKFVQRLQTQFSRNK